jgi:hypothetical protein
LLVETDDQSATFAQRRRAQVAGRTRQQLDQLAAAGPLALEIQADHLLAFGHVELIDILEQPQRLLGLERALAGIDLLSNLDFFLRKEPLRFRAGLSTGAVIAPIDSGHPSPP